MPRLRFRSVVVGSAFSFLTVTALVAAGNYQPTKDGKTFVWNGSPRPGDSATWDGGRDDEGYASGFGTLAWYTAKGNLFGMYYGNMLHGKFEGWVNVHSRGKTGHAMFANGERVSSWATGAAPSRPEPGLTSEPKPTAQKPPAQAEKTPTRAEVTPAIVEATPPKPAKKIETPITQPSRPAIAEKKVEPGSFEDELRRTEPAAERSETRTPTPPVKQTTGTETFEPSPIPKSEMRLEQTPPPPPALETPAPSAVTRETESVPTPSPTQPKKEIAAPPIPPPSPEPSAENKSQISEQSPRAESSSSVRAKGTPADISLNSLAGPPSSLRTRSSNEIRLETTPPETKPSPQSEKSETMLPETKPSPPTEKIETTPPEVKSSPSPAKEETPPPTAKSSASSEKVKAATPEQKSSPPVERSEAQLGEFDAISAADAEMRALGGEPDQYERPKADYSAVTGKWTLFYAAKSGIEVRGPRTVIATVEDKTKKVEFKK